MKTKKDVSFGVVPYIKEDGIFKFLLIHQFSKWRGDTYWVFPKGHAEGDETGEETAKRELMEETGVTVENLDTEHPFVIEYDFIHEGIKVEKTVTFYLGEVSSKEYVLEEEEVKDAGWFQYEEAREKITHDNSKKVLDEVVEYLK